MVEYNLSIKETSYREAQTDVSTHPSWFSTDWPMRLEWAFGSAKDALVNAIKLGTNYRFPMIADNLALSLLFNDRDTMRFTNELELDTRNRLKVAFSTHKLAGTKAGLINLLNAGGYPNVQVFDYWHQPTNSNLTVNLRLRNPWDFCVELHQPLPWDMELLDDWIYGNAGSYHLQYDMGIEPIADKEFVWLDDGPESEKIRVRNMINFVKSAHSHLCYIVVYITERMPVETSTIVVWM